MAQVNHQSRMRGMRVSPLWKTGCPHAYGTRPDGMLACDANDGRYCIFETKPPGKRFCEIFAEVIRECAEELEEVSDVVREA